jgi:cytidylate kinase
MFLFSGVRKMEKSEFFDEYYEEDLDDLSLADLIPDDDSKVSDWVMVGRSNSLFLARLMSSRYGFIRNMAVKINRVLFG